MWQRVRPSDDRRETGLKHLQARDAQRLVQAKGTLSWGPPDGVRPRDTWILDFRPQN